MQDDIKWKSNDFYLCAVCIAAGASLLSLDKISGKFVVFTLDITPSKAEEIITKHWSRELKIPSRDLVEAINELKTRLHSGV